MRSNVQTENFELDNHEWKVPKEFFRGHLDDPAGVMIQFKWRDGKFMPVLGGDYGLLLYVHVTVVPDFDFARGRPEGYSVLPLTPISALVNEKIESMRYIGSNSGFHHFILATNENTSVVCYGADGHPFLGEDLTELSTEKLTCTLGFHTSSHTHVLITAWSVNLHSVGRVFSDALKEVASFAETSTISDRVK